MFACTATLWACGGPIDPTPECQTWVACISARDAEAGITTDLVRFQIDGACWGNPEIAGLCDRGCRNGLAWLRKAEPSLPTACAP